MKKILLLFASFLIFSLFFFLVEGEKAKKTDIRLKGESFFEGLRVIQKKDGVQNWVLTAKRADISKDGGVAHLTGIEMEVKSKGIIIHAEKGFYDLNTRKISTEGPITANTGNYSIQTREIQIDSAAGSLKTGNNVHIQGKKFTLEGKGMEIQNNDQKVRILKDVKATFNN